ncbi:MAG: RuBisCO large subunit C-terminal-like domain-containing protein [Pseudomonadota bacterium]
MTDRFHVTYRIRAGSLPEAEGRAVEIALEQTVEVPRDVVPKGYVEDVILGRVEAVEVAGGGVYAARIGYHPDTVGHSLPQMLNVILGNSSLQQGIRVTALDLGATMQARFPGARFGVAGIRRLTGRPRAGHLCPVLKPMGRSIADLAVLAATAVLAGADIIKEDHGLADQPAHPFRDRVPAIAEAVARANAQRRDGTRALYFPNLGGPAPDLVEAAHRAKAAGADGLLVIPGLQGFDAMAGLARDTGLPVMAHPAFLGAHVLSPDTGFSHGMMFGTLMRLAGADISVFPNHGGRFAFSPGQCDEIVAACRAGAPGMAILPSPGGGMTPERMPDLARAYGPETVYLLGGSLLRSGVELASVISRLRDVLDHASEE